MMRSLHAPAAYTVTLGELVNNGLVDFSGCEWDFESYNTEQRDRIYKKILDRYHDAEIATTPLGSWKRYMLDALNKRAPRANEMYRIIDNGLDEGAEDNKLSRHVYSDFPQTMLSGTQDFASDANDYQERSRHTPSALEQLDALDKYFNPDEYLLSGIRSLFIPLLN